MKVKNEQGEINSVESKAITCSTYPSYPPKQFQQGHLIVGEDKQLNDLIKNSVTDQFNIRPGFPNNIPADQEKNYLGTHFLNWGLWTSSDAAGPNRLESLSSDRLPVGNHVDDIGGNYQEDGHSSNPSVSNPGGKMYTARFFGKDVDIITVEGGENPSDFVSTYNADPENNLFLNNFHTLYHPDFLEMPESDGGSVLQNRTTNDAAYPEGWYNTAASRIKLRNWKGKNNLLSKYNDTSKSEIERNVLTQHCIGTASTAVGLVGGFAKKADFYPYYIDNGQKHVESIQEIIDWHKSKDRNSNIKYYDANDSSALNSGVRNPTILIIEFQYVEQKQNFFKVEDIDSLVHKGKTVTRPEEGWGTNLQPFVDMHLIPFRIEDPDSNDSFHWAIPVGKGPLEGQQEIVEKLEEAWDAGIFVITPVGNGGEVFARTDDVEYNSYFTVPSNTAYFEAQIDNTSNKITSYQTKNYNSSKVFPFRTQGPMGGKRDKGLNVAAGQCSEAHPILDTYTSRGPGIDIIGDGRGIFSAYPDVHFPVDTKLGSNLSLDPNSSQYSSNPYPFEIGQFIRIESLGSGGEAAWRLYTTGNSNGFNGRFKVGSIVQIPTTHPANIPSGAKVTDAGWMYGYFAGTSCAGPTVGGKAACIMEEYLHTNKRWPTPNEVKNILLGTGKVVDAEAPSTYWKDAGSPRFGKTISSPDGSKYLNSYRQELSFGNTSPYGEGATTFATQTGLLTPNLLGWEALNQGSTTIDNSSISNVYSTTDFATKYTIINITYSTFYSHTEILFERDRPLPFKDGDPIVITGATGMTQVNGQQYYLKRLRKNKYALYTDQNLTTALDSSSFGSYNLYSGSVGYFTGITATPNFLTSSGSEVVLNPGDQLTLSGSNSALTDGTYTVISVNNTATPKSYGLLHFSAPMDPLVGGQGAPISNISGTFSVSQAKLNPTTLKDGVTVKLDNVSGQPPAALQANIHLEKGNYYDITVESDNVVNIKLLNPAENVTFANLNEVITSGTITPGKAYTSVNHVGIDKNGNLSNVPFWEQLKTASFDFDEDGTADALTDGLLLLRYLFELRGQALVEDAISLDSILTADEVIENLKNTTAIQDIDGDGRVDALTDGLLLLRYLFELTGNALVDSAISEGATRTTGEEIVEYIERFLPDTNFTTLGYRDSEHSGVPHSAGRIDLQQQQDYRLEDDIAGGVQFNTQYFVEPNNPLLDKYNSPVSVEMFDSKKYFHNPIMKGRAPYTPYQGCAWSWLKENGSKWDSTVMGGVSVGGSSGSNFTVDGTTYTIRDLWWSQGQDEWFDPQTPQTEEYVKPRTSNGILCFSLLNRTNTVAIPNTDAIFGSLDIAGKSFSRADAFYKAGEINSSGVMTPTVWWWHIETFPEKDSEFNALPTADQQTYFALNSSAKIRNNIRIKANAPSQINVPGPLGAITNYKLRISNIDTHNSATIKSVTINNVNTSDSTNLCAAFDSRSSSNSETYSFDQFAFTDLAGTPPLRAVYNGLGHENSDPFKFIQGFSKTSSSPVTQGAVYPNFNSTIASTNDVTTLQVNQDVTSFGWGRTEDDVATATIIKNPQESTQVDFRRREETQSQTQTDYTSEFLKEDLGDITITGSLSAPTVPANGIFAVGPVVATIVPSSLDISYQWQKSTDNSNWTDISATDTVYTKAQTEQLEVQGYSDQTPAGEYYRCKVTQKDRTFVEILHTNSVQAVAG